MPIGTTNHKGLASLTDEEWRAMGYALAEAEAKRRYDAEHSDGDKDQARCDRAAAKAYARLQRKLDAARAAIVSHNQTVEA